MINGYKTSVHVSPWSFTADDSAVTASTLRRYSPSNTNDVVWDDHFRMFEFKVRMCGRAGPHDWTDCPFAHPGEKARRRDPRLYGYSGAACPDFRRGICRRGNACDLAHGVFESWLHPSRYRTQACKDGAGCRRRVCFFAHSVKELRVVESLAAAVPAPAVRKMLMCIERLQVMNEVELRSRMLQKVMRHGFQTTW